MKRQVRQKTPIIRIIDKEFDLEYINKVHRAIRKINQATQRKVVTNANSTTFKKIAKWLICLRVLNFIRWQGNAR